MGPHANEKRPLTLEYAGRRFRRSGAHWGLDRTDATVVRPIFRARLTRPGDPLCMTAACPVRNTAAMSKSRPRRLPFARSRGHDAATTAPPGPVDVAEAGESVAPAVPAPAPASDRAAVTGESVAAAPQQRQRRRFRDWTPFLLVRAAHPRQALLTAVILAGAAALDGRANRELALVFGTEGHGLTARADQLLDLRVTIPMAGGVDSLNVAASSAVAFYATR